MKKGKAVSQKLRTALIAHPVLSILALLAALIVLDNLLHEPVEQPSAHLVVGAVEVYRSHLSRLLWVHGQCKFVPTCSDYMQRAVLRYGSIRGVLKGCSRILRCSPFTDQSGFDYPTNKATPRNRT